MPKIQLKGEAAATIIKMTDVSLAVWSKILGMCDQVKVRNTNKPTSSEYAAATPAISVAVKMPMRKPPSISTGMNKAQAAWRKAAFNRLQANACSFGN